jgi:PTS system nitrogen regulatory IIA component
LEKIAENQIGKKPLNRLAELFRRGGEYRAVPGSAPQEFLSSLAAALALPEKMSRGELLKAVLEREELMPTSVGNGIALPHPRSPLAAGEDDEAVALAYPEKPLPWSALDGIPVTQAMLIISASPRLHLATLQRISFLCHDAAFRSLLEKRAPFAEVLAFLDHAESGWH